MNTTSKLLPDGSKIPNGFIAWEGPSAFDGAPIVVIVTCVVKPSKNPKTGPMVQTFILRQDLRPGQALASGADASICGDCKLRPDPVTGVRRCYVAMHSVTSVWKAYHAGKYPRLSRADAVAALAGRRVRLGAYGDPSAVSDATLWADLVSQVAGWTGYTHAWRRTSALQGLVMASVDTEAEYIDAKATGWRTFRVLGVDTCGAAEVKVKGEVSCPASNEASNLTTCEKCQLCKGTSKNAKDIAIIDHSLPAVARMRRSIGLVVLR